MYILVFPIASTGQVIFFSWKTCVCASFFTSNRVFFVFLFLS